LPLLLALDDELLWIVHCEDPNCGRYARQRVSSGSRPHGRLLIPSAGNPVIAFVESRNEPPTVRHCQTPDCSSYEDHRLPGPGPESWDVVSSGGDLVFAVVGEQGRSLALVRCDGGDCTRTTTLPIPSDTAVGRFDMTTSGEEVWVFTVDDDAQLHATRCRRIECFDVPIQGSVPPADFRHVAAASVAGAPPIAVVLSSGPAAGEVLTQLSCTAEGCTQSALASGASVHTNYTNAAVSADGTLAVAFNDSLTGELELISCHAGDCANAQPRTIGRGGPLDVHFDQDGYPIVLLSTETNGKIGLIHCSSSNCDSSFFQFGRSPVGLQMIGIDTAVPCLPGDGLCAYARMPARHAWRF